MKYFWLFSFLLLFNNSTAQSIVRISQNNVSFRKCSSLKCATIRKLTTNTSGKLLQKVQKETIDGYGTHHWYQIKIGKDTGFVFGALATLITNSTDEIPLNINGSVGGSQVNIRHCGSVECDIVTTLYKGDKLKVIRKTAYRDRIKGLGRSNWYYVDFQGIKGYIYGSLLIADDPTILHLTQKANIYTTPNGKIIQTMPKGKTVDIIKKGKSQVIRPFGRHYWYQIALNNQKKGWIFGGLTTKSKTPVDCQCVDFVKHQLKITSSTKNAHEWDDVLLGKIIVTQNNQPQRLNYREIKDTTLKIGDLVVFSPKHPQAHKVYGHIGFFKDIRQRADKTEILIEGGNHPDKQKAYYTKNRCNNISQKWYVLNQHVRFFTTF